MNDLFLPSVRRTTLSPSSNIVIFAFVLDDVLLVVTYVVRIYLCSMYLLNNVNVMFPWTSDMSAKIYPTRMCRIDDSGVQVFFPGLVLSIMVFRETWGIESSELIPTRIVSRKLGRKKQKKTLWPPGRRSRTKVES